MIVFINYPLFKKEMIKATMIKTPGTTAIIIAICFGPNLSSMKIPYLGYLIAGLYWQASRTFATVLSCSGFKVFRRAK
jgi:hypothetical protein